jgi:hypothetical protein
MRIIEVTGIDGRKHKIDVDALHAEVAKDGERLNVPMLMMDASPEGGLFFCETEQLKGVSNMTNEYKVTDEMQKSVDEAYFEYCQQLNSAWRGKDNPPPAAVPNDTPERAYSEMREAMQHAWKRGAR